MAEKEMMSFKLNRLSGNDVHAIAEQLGYYDFGRLAGANPRLAAGVILYYSMSQEKDIKRWDFPSARKSNLLALQQEICASVSGRHDNANFTVIFQARLFFNKEYTFHVPAAANG